MKNSLTYKYLLVMLFVLGGWASAQEKPQKPQTQTKAEVPWTARSFRLVDRPDEIVEVLPNGMVAIVKENHTTPVAAVRFYVKAGSIYEQDYLGAGLSHIFEHLLVRGATETRSEEESIKILQQIGADWNAYTSKDQTCYHLTVPAQHVGKALNLLADWVTRPTFPADAFDREWGVVQREQEMGADNPDRQLYYLFDELRYKVHPGRYPVIGYQSVLQQVTRQEILDYYRRMYVPDNSIIAVGGDINAVEMLDVIRKEFADFTRRAKTNIVLPDEPEIIAPREMVKVLPSMQGPAKMMIGFPSIKLQHGDLYALDVLAAIMGSGESSRFYRSLREDQQLVFSVYAYNNTPHWACGTFTIVCELAPEKITETRNAVWCEIERIREQPVSPEELARAKRRLQVSHIRSNQTASQQISTMAEDYLSAGETHFSDHYVENIQHVTAEQVRGMAQKYLQAEKQLTLTLTGQPLAQTTETKADVPAESAVRKIVLDNGLRVLLKRNGAVPLVNIQLYVLGGLLDETDQDNGLTNLMTQLSVKGTTNYTAEQIIDYFDSIGGTIETAAGDNTYFYTAEVMGGDLAKAFEIFSEIVLEPTFPEDELAKLKQQILVTIPQIENYWSSLGNRFFRSKFFLDNPYRRISLGTTSSVTAITCPQLHSFHKDHTVASRAVLTVFGDIDLAVVENMVRQRFSTLPKGEPFDPGKFKPEPAVEGDRQFVEATTMNGAMVYVGFPGMKLTDIQDRYPMEVLTEIIGSTSSSDWLFGKLRGAQLVYYARGFSFAGLLPGYIAANAQCEAEKVPQVIQVIRELLAKAVKGQFTEEELARAKSSCINAETLSRQTNAAAAMTAALDELYGFGYDWSKGHADRILAVTLADLQSIARKYLSVPATITVNTSKPEILNKDKKPAETKTPNKNNGK